MFKYKTGEYVNMGDRVKVSKKWAKEYGSENATVVGKWGFVTVQFDLSTAKVDFDMRSLTFVSRAS